jgi:hypothetical protein
MSRDARVMQILLYGIIGLAAGWPIVLFIGWPLPVALPLVTAALGLAIHALVHVMSAGAGAVFLRATGAQPGGAAEGTYFGMSVIDALVARGQVDEAIEQLRIEQFAYVGQPAAEIAQRLADLLLRRGLAAEAAQAYGRARRAWERVPTIEGTEGQVYATRRLLDLFEGPLANPAAADRERERLRVGRTE